MAKDQASARLQAATAAIGQIKERFGEGSIMRLGEAKATAVDAVPTGCLSLDIALGPFGVPRGRIIEIYGPESSGKTTLTLHAIAEIQKQGGTAAFIDAEHALDGLLPAGFDLEQARQPRGLVEALTAQPFAQRRIALALRGRLQLAQ